MNEHFYFTSYGLIVLMETQQQIKRHSLQRGSSATKGKRAVSRATIARTCARLMTEEIPADVQEHDAPSFKLFELLFYLTVLTRELI